jgi:hypothetical protein
VEVDARVKERKEGRLDSKVDESRCGCGIDRIFI